jgi:hypothetical protein
MSHRDGVHKSQRENDGVVSVYVVDSFSTLRIKRTLFMEQITGGHEEIYQKTKNQKLTIIGLSCTLLLSYDSSLRKDDLEDLDGIISRFCC